jgi:hypothetical protein
LSFWQAWNEYAAWSPALLPVGEWKGLLYIASSDPQLVISAPSECVRLLAQAKDLQALWDSWHQPARLIDGPSGLKLDANLSPAADSMGSTAPDGLKASLQPSSDASRDNQPDGLRLIDSFSAKHPDEDTAPAGLKWKLSSDPAAPPKAAPPKPEIGAGSAPFTPSQVSQPRTEISAKASPQPSAPPAGPATPAEPPKRRDLKSMRESLVAKVEEITQTGISASELERQSASPDFDPEATRSAISFVAKASEAVARADADHTQNTLELTNVTARVDRANPSSAGSGTVTGAMIEMIPFERCSSFDQLAAVGIGQILKSLDHAMILLFQGGELRPWRWSEHWLPVHPESPASVPLDRPSLFRIVYRTTLPYHGYVMTNDINQKFFNEWNRGQVPDHLTAVPIVVDQKIAGMAIGLINDRKLAVEQSRPTLKAVERIGQELGQQFRRLKSKPAAAA